MTTHDGTQERTLQPPDDTLSDADMRECERAAQWGFDDIDDRARKWLDEEILADTPVEAWSIVRAAILNERSPLKFGNTLSDAVDRLRDRYIAECAEEYWPDLMDQAAHAQEA